MKIKITFDPSHTTGHLRNVFDDDVARTLWLLWKRGHLTNDDFSEECVVVADRIRESKPETAEELARCFPTLDPRGSNFTAGDVERFTAKYLGFFTGDDSVEYEVVSS